MGYRQRPRLREETLSLMYAIDGATARPTKPQLDRKIQLQEETNVAMKAFDTLLNKEIASLNQLLKEMPQLMVGPGKP